MKQKVAVGLSGGVDSAVAAALLKDQGYEVTGVHLVCFNEPGCRADQDRQDALQVALKLKIPFKILDFRKAYRDKVLGYFWSEIKQGRTPNPDVICNQEIKFGLLYQWIKKHGFDCLATGHYARISQREQRLVIPKDKRKDQTYFLYRVQPSQLKHLVFPLADLTKAQVRERAKELGLPVADKKDSTGICFIGELNVRHFLREKLGEKEGEVVDIKGDVIGKHRGYWFYTIGQRHGFTILPPIQSSQARKLYVVRKDRRKNQLVIGKKAAAMRDKFMVEELNWLAHPKTEQPKKVKVRIRHQGKLLSCQLLVGSDKLVKVKLDTLAFGVAPGQSVVFYQDGMVLGGGVIVD